MPIIVKKTIVWLQRFGMDTLRQALRDFRSGHVCAVAAHIDSVVLSQAAVLTGGLSINGYVAKDNGQAVTGSADCIAVAGEIFCVCIDFPEVAKDISTDAELGEYGQFTAFFANAI